MDLEEGMSMLFQGSSKEASRVPSPPSLHSCSSPDALENRRSHQEQESAEEETEIEPTDSVQQLEQSCSSFCNSTQEKSARNSGEESEREVEGQGDSS